MRIKIIIIVMSIFLISLPGCGLIDVEQPRKVKKTSVKHSAQSAWSRCRDENSDSHADTKSPKRTIKSIQSHMNVRKKDVYFAYRKALRDAPNLSGTICLELTVSPDGDVVSSSVKFSEVGNLEFEENILKVMDSVYFGKYDLPTITFLYPLHFKPPKN